MRNEYPYKVCFRCGITANVLTCLKRYGKPPLQNKSAISSVWIGECGCCGEETEVTEVRDFYHPDFQLIKQVVKHFNRKEGDEMVSQYKLFKNKS